MNRRYFFITGRWEVAAARPTISTNLKSFPCGNGSPLLIYFHHGLLAALADLMLAAGFQVLSKCLVLRWSVVLE